MPDNTCRARDEAFWQTFADRYDVEPGPINLENGYFGRMSRTVVEEYQRNIEFINRSNSVYVRQRFEQAKAWRSARNWPSWWASARTLSPSPATPRMPCNR